MWELAFEHGQFVAHFVGHVERVRARRLIDRQPRRRLAIEGEDLPVGLRSELDPPHVAEPRDLAGAAGLDDHLREFGRVAEPAGDVERVLERLAAWRGGRADLSRRDLRALLPQRLDHVLRHQPARLHFVGVEPNAHRILAGAEHDDVAHAGQAGDFVLELDGRVIGEIEAVVARVGRRQRDDLQDRRRILLHDDALRLHRLRQRGQRSRYPVLYQDLRNVEVGADLERHRQRVAAIGAAVGLHVDHAFDAVHLLLDGQGDGIDEGAGACSGIARGDLHRRRHHVGVLRHRQRKHGDAADHNHQDGQHVRKNGPRDEKIGDHGAAAICRPRQRPASQRGSRAADRPSDPGSPAGCRRRRCDRRA